MQEQEDFHKQVWQVAELIPHGKDGKIQNLNSYGNDPYPPKDTKH